MYPDAPAMMDARSSSSRTSDANFSTFVRGLSLLIPRQMPILGEYMDVTGLWYRPKEPMFHTVDTTKSQLKGTRINRHLVFQMVRRRARKSGLSPTVNCHSFRATGITNYSSNGGNLEDARAIAAHESSQTTRLYDRTGDRITLDEIERIRF